MGFGTAISKTDTVCGTGRTSSITKYYKAEDDRGFLIIKGGLPLEYVCRKLRAILKSLLSILVNQL